MTKLLTEKQWARETREAGRLAANGLVDGESRTWLYFAQVGEAVKIGYSSRPRDRIRLLRVDNPGTVEILALVRGTIRGEQEIHERFAHLRLRGEWFAADPELLTFALLCQLHQEQVDAAVAA